MYVFMRREKFLPGRVREEIFILCLDEPAPPVPCPIKIQHQLYHGDPHAKSGPKHQDVKPGVPPPPSTKLFLFPCGGVFFPRYGKCANVRSGDQARILESIGWSWSPKNSWLLVSTVVLSSYTQVSSPQVSTDVMVP